MEKENNANIKKLYRMLDSIPENEDNRREIEKIKKMIEKNDFGNALEKIRNLNVKRDYIAEAMIGREREAAGYEDEYDEEDNEETTLPPSETENDAAQGSLLPCCTALFGRDDDADGRHACHDPVRFPLRLRTGTDADAAAGKGRRDRKARRNEPDRGPGTDLCPGRSGQTGGNARADADAPA